jgi:hypothetical protein
MFTLLALIAIVIFINALPAFAPPTWTILVFFEIHYGLNPVALVISGVCAATIGRAILALYFRKFAEVIPTRFSKNMLEAGAQLEKRKNAKYTLLGLFFLSPLSSAQLFEAAGLMKTVALKPLLIAFAAGRMISYSGYVAGAHALNDSSIGSVVINHLKSPWAIALQFVMIAALIALGMVDWSRLKKR